jgi:hypothetical protein
MKAFFGIERIKLKAQRVRGGYKVKGVLPWISNLGPDHRFGVVFELNDMPEHRVMAVINCAGEGVKTVQSDHFVALEGTRTFSVQLRDSFISDDDVLADPIDYYIPRIRAGFILFQSGMAFGLIRNCIQLMKQERTNLGLINKYIEKQPEDFDASLASLEDQVCARRRLKPGRATSGVSWKLGWLRGKLRCKPHHAMLHRKRLPFDRGHTAAPTRILFRGHHHAGG